MSSGHSVVRTLEHLQSYFLSKTTHSVPEDASYSMRPPPPIPTTTKFVLRDFAPSDADDVNTTAIAAFSDFKDRIGDWPSFERAVGNMSSLATENLGELIVATVAGRVAGAVGYVGPGIPKQEWFEPEWPVVRMLVVHPAHRGLGVGRALTEECIRRARRDAAPLIALHTTRMMDVAVGMYERMGFVFLRESPPRHGVEYGIWVKRLV